VLAERVGLALEASKPRAPTVSLRASRETPGQMQPAMFTASPAITEPQGVNQVLTEIVALVQPFGPSPSLRSDSSY